MKITLSDTHHNNYSIIEHPNQRLKLQFANTRGLGTFIGRIRGWRTVRRVINLLPGLIVHEDEVVNAGRQKFQLRLGRNHNIVDIVESLLDGGAAANSPVVVQQEHFVGWSEIADDFLALLGIETGPHVRMQTHLADNDGLLT